MYVSLFVVMFSAYESSAQLTARDRDEILRAHNHVRSLVSPSATDMTQMVG